MKRIIGFIGLGIMGKPMAKNLIKAGFPLVVYNRSKGPIDHLVKKGAISANSPKELAQQANVIITMLPDSPEVEKVILGKDGIIHGVKSGSVLIDMSSIDPFATRKIARALEDKRVKMLDAPVTGGETGAIQGTLTIMVGGEEKVLKDCIEILQVIGKNVHYVGEIGSGGYIKLVTQIIGALNMAAIAEAFCFGVKAGLDPQAMYRVIRGGMTGNQLLDAKMPIILRRDFKPGFKTKLHYKDLSNALCAANGLGVPLVLTSLVQQILVSLVREGKGEEDNSVLVTFFERMAGVEIRSTETQAGLATE